MEEFINIISTPELPSDIKEGAIYSIETSDVAYLTHNYFKYPCKFIPQIPRWAMNAYAREIAHPSVYDPFVGSGTTLVEGVLGGYDAYGSDVDPLGRLLTSVKAGKYSKNDVNDITKAIDNISENLQNPGKETIPDLPNIAHWFNESNISKLGRLNYEIESVKNDKAQSFLKVVFASIIRKASRADEMSPKPYISTKYKREGLENIFELFEKRSRDYLSRLKEYIKVSSGQIKYLGDSALKSNIKGNSIDIAITSPPYINAFDYVRSLKLENYWLGLVDDETSRVIRKNNVGTESIKLDDPIERIEIPLLRKAVNNINEKDRRRAKIVDKYFNDMKANLLDVYRILKPGSKYIIVVANSNIRNEPVLTKDILIEIGRSIGFKYVNHFGYVIRNRYLRIPRTDRGGIMKVDWVIILEK